MEKCRVCLNDCLPGHFRDCCSKECARVLVHMRALANLSMHLTMLVEATRPGEYQGDGHALNHLVSILDE